MASKKNTVKNDIERITAAIVANAERVRISTFNTVKGKMSRRIFNDGIATDGSRIGNYSTKGGTHSYKRFRNRYGFRIDTVDLELTGTLIRAFQVGVSEGKTVIGIADFPEPTITTSKGRIVVTGLSEYRTTENAINQESHFKKEIFAPSKEEIQRGEKTVIKEINLIVRKALG